MPSLIEILERFAAVIQTHRSFDELLSYIDQHRDDLLDHQESREALVNALAHAPSHHATRVLELYAAAAPFLPETVPDMAVRVIDRATMSAPDILAAGKALLEIGNTAQAIWSQVSVLSRLHALLKIAPASNPVEDQARAYFAYGIAKLGHDILKSIEATRNWIPDKTTIRPSFWLKNDTFNPKYYVHTEPGHPGRLDPLHWWLKRKTRRIALDALRYTETRANYRAKTSLRDSLKRRFG